MEEQLGYLRKLFSGKQFEKELKDYIEKNPTKTYTDFCTEFNSKVELLFKEVRKKIFDSKVPEQQSLVAMVGKQVLNTEIKCYRKIDAIEETRDDLTNSFHGYFAQLVDQGGYSKEEAEKIRVEALRKAEKTIHYILANIYPPLLRCKDILEYHRKQFERDFEDLPSVEPKSKTAIPITVNSFNWLGKEEQLKQLFFELQKENFIARETSLSDFKLLFNNCPVFEISNPVNWIDKSEKGIGSTTTVFSLISALSEKGLISIIDFSNKKEIGRLYQMLEKCFLNNGTSKDRDAWKTTYSSGYKGKNPSSRALTIQAIVSSLTS